MKMHNPPHPGEFIKEVFLDSFNISIREVANKMKISPSTLSRLIKKETNVSPEMAIRLSKTLGRTPESWLLMQDNYNLFKVEKEVDFSGVEKLAISA